MSESQEHGCFDPPFPGNLFDASLLQGKWGGNGPNES